MKDQMRNFLLDFMMTFGLLAANTFGARAVTWESYRRARSGDRSSLQQTSVRRVLDYILVPCAWTVVQSKAAWVYQKGGSEQHSRL